MRPHEDPDPGRRVARRILQRLDGMGKWGGYHTEFAHLARGFAGNDRALAQEVGEALLEAGLLAEKPSVGQRHVYLNPRTRRRDPPDDRHWRAAAGYDAAVPTVRDRAGHSRSPAAHDRATRSSRRS